MQTSSSTSSTRPAVDRSPLAHAPELRLQDVAVAFGGTSFQVRSFRVAAGDQLLICGPSGHGKTTLLHLLGGLLVPSRGEVWVGATNLCRLSEGQRSQLRRREFGVIFQTLNLLTHLTPLENVLLAARCDRTAALNALAAVKMGGLAHAATAALSLGQQQRVAVARVLAARPKVILADEPTSSLDQANADLIMDALLTAARGATLVMVSHDIRIRDRLARVVAIDEVLSR